MLLRGVRCALAAAVATLWLLVVSPVGVSAAASVGSTPSLTLLSQTPTVAPPAPGDPATFALAVRVAGSAPSGATLGLSFYEKLSTQSGFAETLTGTPSGLLHTVAPQPLASLKRPGGGEQIDVTVVAGTTSAPSGSTTLNVSDLSRCPPLTDPEECSGVYPVVVQLFDSSGSEIAHLNTYLVYEETRSASPLVFSWVVPMGANVRIRSDGPITDAIPPLGAARVRDLAALSQELAANPGVQATVAPSPAVVERLRDDPSPEAASALRGLRTIALEGTHRLLAQPYVPVNLAQLAAAGVPSEIQGQKNRASAVMAPITVGLSAAQAPSWQTWLATGPVGPSIAAGMRDVGSDSLVLPDSALASATEEDHATWTQPFSLTLGHGESVTAAVSDSMLSNLFTSHPADPVLEANELLAGLAFIQSELPSAGGRGVIGVPPPSWNPDPRFVDALVSGLSNNPVVSTATLNGYFNEVQIGANGATTTRRLNDGADQLLSRAQAAAIATARTEISGFVDAVQGQPPIENQLEDVLLSAESDQLSPDQQRAALAVFERHFEAELGNVQVEKNSITLTAQTAAIPITIVSSAHYALRANLTLSSPKLEFPGGPTRDVLIDHPTNSAQVQVRARTSGDLPLSFTLSSPNGQLVIERGRFTVRSTATSIVGIVLTLVAAAVLIGWWGRTWLKGRRERRSRAQRGAPA